VARIILLTWRLSGLFVQLQRASSVARSRTPAKAVGTHRPGGGAGAAGNGGNTSAPTTIGHGGNGAATAASGTQPTGTPDAAPDGLCSKCALDAYGMAVPSANQTPPVHPVHQRMPSFRQTSNCHSQYDAPGEPGLPDEQKGMASLDGERDLPRTHPELTEFDVRTDANTLGWARQICLPLKDNSIFRRMGLRFHRTSCQISTIHANRCCGVASYQML